MDRETIKKVKCYLMFRGNKKAAACDFLRFLFSFLKFFLNLEKMDRKAIKCYPICREEIRKLLHATFMIFFFFFFFRLKFFLNLEKGKGYWEVVTSALKASKNKDFYFLFFPISLEI
jgi:hypothetical protein